MKNNNILSVLTTMFLMVFITNTNAQIVCQSSFSYLVDTNSNTTINFTDLSTGQPQGGTMTWLWDFGDNSFSQLQNPSHTYQLNTPNGVYNVCLTITYTTGGATCNSVYCDSVLVGGNNNNIVCQASFTGSQSLVDSLKYNFSSTSNASTNGNPLTYQWDLGDGTIASVANPSHTYAQAAVYNVCLTITDNLGCTDSYCDSIIVGTSGTNNGVGCQASFTGSISLIDSMTYYFTDLSSGSNALSYNWDFGDGSGATGANPSHTYLLSGVYGVCLTVTDIVNNCTNTYCDSIIVGTSGSGNNGNNNAPCNAYFWQYQDSANVNTVYLLDLSYGTGLSYSWDFGDGNTSTQQAPTHTYAQLGNYNICLTITSIGGGMTCTSVYCDSVAVDTNMLRSSGFTIQVVTEADMLSNTKELTKNTNFSFYPNPVKDKLYIDFNGTSGKPILELLDMSGKRIMKAEINRENNFFNVHDIPSGMYIIKINTVDKQIRNKLMKN